MTDLEKIREIFNNLDMCTLEEEEQADGTIRVDVWAIVEVLTIQETWLGAIYFDADGNYLKTNSTDKDLTEWFADGKEE